MASNITNATLAQKISDLIDSWRTYMGQLRAWLGGTVGGGPNGDGAYPLTDDLGTTYMVKSPAQMAADVNNTVSGSAASATAAAASASAAAASSSAASTSATAAATSATVAANSASAANNYQAQAASYRTAAINAANAASAAAASVSNSAADASAAHADRLAADVDAAAAATSAGNAATSATAAASAEANCETIQTALQTFHFVETVILTDPLDGGNITDAPAVAVFNCGTLP
jgi:hypothetical protein